METSSKPAIVICSHKKPQDQCRKCIIQTFILCEKYLNTPWLTKDARSVIFSHLPEEIVVPYLCGEVYEFKEGTRVTVPAAEPIAQDMVCGFEVKRQGIPYNIYCSARATKQGISGFYSCSKHAARKSPSMGVCFAKRNKIISLKGMKYRMEKQSPF
jgi:hypothetical protein